MLVVFEQTIDVIRAHLEQSQMLQFFQTCLIFLPVDLVVGPANHGADGINGERSIKFSHEFMRKRFCPLVVTASSPLVFQFVRLVSGVLCSMRTTTLKSTDDKNLVV